MSEASVGRGPEWTFRSVISILSAVTAALALSLVIHLLFAAALREGSVFSPNQRAGVFIWPDSAIHFALRGLLSIAIAAGIAWIAAKWVAYGPQFHAAIVALEYSAISTLVLEQTVRTSVVRIDDNVFGTFGQTGGMTAIAFLFDLVVVATVPLAWLIARWIRSRRTSPASDA